MFSETKRSFSGPCFLPRTLRTCEAQWVSGSGTA